MAYATLQPGMKYFDAFGGYLAYDQCCGVPMVLADPVAPRERHLAIIEAFARRHPHACFCQISKPVGAILARWGWSVNEFGADMELDLPTYDFNGPKKSKLRQAGNKVEREGYIISEATDSQIDQADLQALTASWLATKTVKREARFLVRPMQFGPEPGVRKFYLHDSRRRVVAFIVFDPICEEGKVIGYSPSVKRRSTDAPTGAEEAISKCAIAKFRAEGLKTFRLGLLPFYQVEGSGFPDSLVLRKLFQWAYQYGDQLIYGFRGLADFKHRYRGEITKTYFASATHAHIQNLIALLRVCRLC